MKDVLYVFAEDEEDFVEKYLTTPRPFTIWMKKNLDLKKIHEIAKERGIFFMNMNSEPSETIYL